MRVKSILAENISTLISAFLSRRDCSGRGFCEGGGFPIRLVFAVEGEAGFDGRLFMGGGEGEGFFGPGDGFGEVVEFRVGGGEGVEDRMELRIR